jgi:rhamnogalacturonyl hydrolase YesR
MVQTVTPDLAIVSSVDESSVFSRELVARLLSLQVSFTGRTEQKFLSTLPGTLEGLKAIIIEDKIFINICQRRKDELERLSNFAETGNVHVLNYPLGSDREKRLPCNFQFQTQIPSMVTMSGVKCGDFNNSMVGPEFEIIFKESVDKLFQFMKKAEGHFSEFHLHNFKPALTLMNFLPSSRKQELRELFVNAANSFSTNQRSLLHHDKAGALFSAVEVYEITKDCSAADKMIELVDDMMARRSRTHSGLLSGTGFSDDPLGLSEVDFEHFDFWSNSNTDFRKNSVWTEWLHFYGPCFGAAYRYTKEQKYLDEIMQILDFIDKVHRDKDGLIFHVSMDSKITSSKWGRGIGHALYGAFYLLQELRKGEPEKEKIKEFIKTTFDALIKYQDENSGLWRNVIDNPQSCLESSCSVCFACVGICCINMGILNREKFLPMVSKVLNGLRKIYWKGGFACQCVGTGTSCNDKFYYLSRGTSWREIPQIITALIEAKKAGILQKL